MINNSLYRRNKPNFSANIKFTPFDVFKNKNVKIVTDTTAIDSGLQIATHDVLMCNAGGITGGNTNQNLLFHLFGDDFLFKFCHISPQKLIELEKKFAQTVAELKKLQLKPRGLIFGGMNKDVESKEFLVVLKYFFNKHKIDPTIFWGTTEKTGRNYPSKEIFYDGLKDIWNVNIEECKIKKKHALDAFEYIYVSPQDNIKFPDTGWISGKERSLNKGHIDLTMEDVLKKYKVDPKILESLSE